MVVTNSRLKNAADQVRVFVDQRKAPELARDLEEAQLDDNGELDEGPEGKRSHMSDAAAYLLCQRFGAATAAARGKELTSRAM